MRCRDLSDADLQGLCRAHVKNYGLLLGRFQWSQGESTRIEQVQAGPESAITRGIFAGVWRTKGFDDSLLPGTVGQGSFTNGWIHYDQ